MSQAKAGAIHIALLRGINVSGRNRLPMADLVSIFEGAGSSDVVTYIQSGNVVLRAKDALARKLPELVAAAIAKQFGYRIPVVMRSAPDFERLVRSNPFESQGTSAKSLHVAFLENQPTADQIAALDPKRSAGDRFEIIGKEIYLHCPNGLARSKLTNAYFDAKLQTTSTFRNWRTTLHLYGMLR